MNNKKRFRDYGLASGLLPVGPLNSIADVPGVRVGHTTKIEGETVRTGVTVIDPGVPNLFVDKIPGAITVGNGFGKLAGSTQVEELGTIEAPIALTNTLAVGPVMRGVINHVIRTTPSIQKIQTINAVVGETNDGFLNDIHAESVTAFDVNQAFANLSSIVDTGCVGAGTGTRAFAWKGGIGTASRRVILGGIEYTFGVLVQTNYGGDLTIMGVPIGSHYGKTDFTQWYPMGDGSCMFVIATNAPLSARQLKRIANRSVIALGRTGSVMANGSGDYAIAFSTNRAGLDAQEGACIVEDQMTGAFLATVEACEEAVYDALFSAETMQGREGHVMEALPKEEVAHYVRTRLQK